MKQICCQELSAIAQSGRTGCRTHQICSVKAPLHWRFYLDENVGVLATVSMFVVMDVYDSQGKQIHAPWDVTF